MSCLVRDVMMWLEECFPAQSAEPWDLVGLQVGDPSASVKGVLVALDPTYEALEEAARLGASLVVTHHPVWLGSLKAIRWDEPEGRIICSAIKKGIQILCVHTNLDKAWGGPNDLLAQALGLQDIQPLGGGIGRIGVLPREMEVLELCGTLATRHPQIRIAGAVDLKVRTVAVCCGSGASLLVEARHCGAQVLVTGDVKYHDARRAEALGIALVDASHYGTEKALVPWLAQRLREASSKHNWGISVWCSQGQQDPFWEPLLSKGGEGIFSGEVCFGGTNQETGGDPTSGSSPGRDPQAEESASPRDGKADGPAKGRKGSS
ncbi:MAG: Nif3-like dinuclear metal center hexameric protein [bacterium]